MSVLPTSQNKRRALYRNLSVGLIAVVVALALASRALAVDVHAITAVLLVPILVLSLLQVSALDEAAKQAHFTAWYWGCLVAIVAIAKQAHFTAWYWGCLVAIVAIGAIAVGVTQGAMPFEPIAAIVATWIGAGQANMFAAGLLTSLVLMLAGYLVFSTIHWLRTL